MKFLALTAATLAAVAPALAQSTMQVDTVANIVQCQPIQFTWHGGQGPYFLSLIPAAQPSAPAIKQFPQQTGTAFTWLVDLPAGSTFTIALKDSTGATAFSDIESINNSTDTTCLNTAVTDDGKGNTATGGATSTPSGATTTPGTGSPAATSSGSSATTSPTTPAKNQNAAGKNTVGAFGVAAIMGLVGAALF